MDDFWDDWLLFTLLSDLAEGVVDLVSWLWGGLPGRRPVTPAAPLPLFGPCDCCQHTYARRPGWWHHTASWCRYECTRCGDRTRRYDHLDGHAGRPVHLHMTVASAVNTVPRPAVPGWGR